MTSTGQSARNAAVFWQLIARLDWTQEGDDDAVIAPVVEALSQGPVADIEQFEETLAEYLYALDTREHARYGFLGEADPDDGESYISADFFLYLRCVVVANGKKFYDKVLADPTQMPRDLEFESLLAISHEAYSAKTGEELAYDTRLSYESYSNEAGWASTADTTSGTFTSEAVPPGNRRPAE